MAVVLNMVGFDTTTPINCQVGPDLRIPVVLSDQLCLLRLGLLFYS